MRLTFALLALALAGCDDTLPEATQGDRGRVDFSL